jgi:aryl-alcohol dehydrogenase-like predicted oxidoreductase
MTYRQLGRTDMHVSSIGFGAWAIGGSWGPVDDENSMRALHAAIDAGVNFIDTADVYGDGHSERLVGRLCRERPGERLFIATKAGRRLPAQTPEGYTRQNLAAWVDRSLANLGVDTIDLLQLHCPPAAVYERAEVFGFLDDLVRAGKLRHYGVSVETCAEARRALDYPGVQSVQIVFNIFRLKPAERVFSEASKRQVGILARVPLASGLLTGKLTADSRFHPEDHRQFNRKGEAFDQGETLSGVPLDVGAAAAVRLGRLVPPGATMAQLALRWILMFEAVTCTIPGARTESQARENAAAADLPPLTPATMSAIDDIYDADVRALVEDRW